MCSLKIFSVILLILAIAAFHFFEQSLRPNKEHLENKSKRNDVIKYWPFVQNMWNPKDNLRTIKRVMGRFGHKMVNGSETDDWDLMWSIEYPFYVFPDKMKALKPLQKVNHFPGIFHLTNKKVMSTNNFHPFIPRAFEFPRMVKEFKEFVKKNPEKKFVVKNEANRGVKIVSIDEIGFESSNQKFYQEFIENPLLFDGRVHDIGVYVLVTSVNPLRIYRFSDDVLLRLCPEKYFPFDAKNIEKYVIYESHKLIFDIPWLQKQVLEFNMTSKSSLEVHLEAMGMKPEDLWKQIDNIIVTLFLENEEKLLKNAESFGKIDNFFELVRFDFIIDDQFKVHLMEINMR